MDKRKIQFKATSLSGTSKSHTKRLSADLERQKANRKEQFHQKRGIERGSSTDVADPDTQWLRQLWVWDSSISLLDEDVSRLKTIMMSKGGSLLIEALRYEFARISCLEHDYDITYFL